MINLNPNPEPNPNPSDFENDSRYFYVYRIDSRPPAVVFQHGFHSWGTNYNFMDHITGGSNLERLNLGLAPDDGFISTSSSISASLRFLTAQLRTNNPVWRNVYLYEIRADGTYFSAQATAPRLLSDIRRGAVVFDDPDEMQEAIQILRNMVRRVAYQREFMTTRDIPGNRISQAWRITIAEVRSERGEVTNLPQLSEDGFTNPNFQDLPPSVTTNILPFTPDFSPLAPRRYRLQQSEGAAADAGIGAIVTGGLACRDPGGPTTRKKRSTRDPIQNICFGVDKGVNKYTLKYSEAFVNHHPKYIWDSPFFNSFGQGGFHIKVGFASGGYRGFCPVGTTYDGRDGTLLLFDEYGRILIKSEPENTYNMAITVGNSQGDYDIYEMHSSPAVINDLRQRFWVKMVNERAFFYSQDPELKGHTLYYDKMSHRLYFGLEDSMAVSQMARVYLPVQYLNNLDFVTGCESPTPALIDVALYGFDNNTKNIFSFTARGEAFRTAPASKTILYNQENESIVGWDWFFGRGLPLFLVNVRSKMDPNPVRVIWGELEKWIDQDKSRWYFYRVFDSGVGRYVYKIYSNFYNDRLMFSLDDDTYGYLMTVRKDRAGQQNAIFGMNFAAIKNEI